MERRRDVGTGDWRGKNGKVLWGNILWQETFSVKTHCVGNVLWGNILGQETFPVKTPCVGKRLVGKH